MRMILFIIPKLASFVPSLKTIGVVFVGVVWLS